MKCTMCQSIEGVEPQELRERQVMNSLSRRDNKTYICNLCGNAEALMDYIPGLTFQMARLAVENDFQQLMRLPDVDPFLVEALSGFFPGLAVFAQANHEED